MKKEKNEIPVMQTEQLKAAKALVKFVRIAPRKIRVVIDTIRFKHPEQAFSILASINKKGARITEKLLKTAVANAKVLGMEENRLFIADVRADGGPTMKRVMQRSMGRADRLVKRTTHLSMILKEGVKKFNVDEAPAVVEEIKKTSKSAKEGSKPAKAKTSAKKKTAAKS